MQIIDSIFINTAAEEPEQKERATEFADIFMKLIEIRDPNIFTDTSEGSHQRAFINNTKGCPEWFKTVDTSKNYRQTFHTELVDWFMSMFGVAHDYNEPIDHDMSMIECKLIISIGSNGDLHFRFYYGPIDETFDVDIDPYDGLDIIFNEAD